MKRMLAGVVLFIGIMPSLLALSSSFDFEAGAFYGSRRIADSDIKRVYGEGMIYFPFVTLGWRGIILGGGYEGGYSKSGKIGLYQESSTLRISGFELFIGYGLRIKSFSPYFKVGYGLYSYKQTIDSPYVSGFKVDHKRSTITVGAGIKFYPIKYLFVAGEVRYVPLKVKPFEEEIDLSGLRMIAGIGFSI